MASQAPTRQRRTVAQPQSPAGIDWNNPLTRGLVSAPLWSISSTRPHDPANSRSAYTPGGNESRLIDSNGIALSFSASTAGIKTSTLPLDPINGMTALMLFRPASSTPAANLAMCGWGQSVDFTPILYIFQVGTTGHFGFQFRDTTGLGPNVTVTEQLLAGVTYALAMRTNGTNLHSCAVNQNWYTDTTAMAGWSAPDNYAIGGLYRAAWSVPMGAGGLHGPYLFNRYLTDTEVSEWMRNPWQVFAPPPRLVQAPASAALPVYGTLGQFDPELRLAAWY